MEMRDAPGSNQALVSPNFLGVPFPQQVRRTWTPTACMPMRRSILTSLEDLTGAKMRVRIHRFSDIREDGQQTIFRGVAGTIEPPPIPRALVALPIDVSSVVVKTISSSLGSTIGIKGAREGNHRRNALLVYSHSQTKLHQFRLLQEIAPLDDVAMRCEHPSGQSQSASRQFMYQQTKCGSSV